METLVKAFDAAAVDPAVDDIKSLVGAYFGRIGKDDFSRQIKIGFGQQGDKFYKKTSFSVWSVLVGIGPPPEDQISALVGFQSFSVNTRYNRGGLSATFILLVDRLASFSRFFFLHAPGYRCDFHRSRRPRVVCHFGRHLCWTEGEKGEAVCKPQKTNRPPGATC